MEAIGAEQLAIYVADLQEKLKIKQTAQGRIALVGCETDRPSSGGTSAAITSLAQSVAKRLYDSGNGTFRCDFFTHKQLFQSLYFFIKINQWIPQHFTVAFNRFSFLSNFPFACDVLFSQSVI
jgi:hypothetical protein